MDIYKERVIKTDSCWIWTGAKRGPYGTVTINKKTHGIHRIFYKHYKGDLIPGLVIDHLCRNTLCVNPKHLEQVTNAENVKRAAPFKPKSIRKKEVCKHGHELMGSNLYYSKNGVRRCKECMIIYQRNYRKSGTK